MSPSNRIDNADFLPKLFAWVDFFCFDYKIDVSLVWHSIVCDTEAVQPKKNGEGKLFLTPFL